MLYYFRAALDGCMVCGCMTSHQPAVTLFSFPSDKVRRLKWQQFARKTGLMDSGPYANQLCSQHFTQYCFVNWEQVNSGKVTKHVLKEDAVPTINFPNIQSSEEENIKVTITPSTTLLTQVQTDTLSEHTVSLDSGELKSDADVNATFTDIPVIWLKQKPQLQCTCENQHLELTSTSQQLGSTNKNQQSEPTSKNLQLEPTSKNQQSESSIKQELESSSTDQQSKPLCAPRRMPKDEFDSRRYHNNEFHMHMLKKVNQLAQASLLSGKSNRAIKKQAKATKQKIVQVSTIYFIS